MSSSLAAQLAGIKANNNATILDSSKRKKLHGVSLVHEPKEAAAQDFESIYYASLEAFRELENVDKRFSAFSKTIFSETSIRFDRLVQDQDSAAALNQTIERFLMLISGYLHLQPSFRTLEWLVRRFQVHIHNTESLILAALPWHSSEEFIRILDIIPAHQLPPLFQFLSSSKQHLKGPSKNAIVRVMAKDAELFSGVNNYILKAVQNGLSFNRQLVFWSSINIAICMVYKERGDTEIVDRLLPIIAEVLPLSKRPMAQIAAYMLLAVLSTQFTLKDEIIDAIITTISSNLNQISQKQAIVTVAQLIQQSSPDYTEQPFSHQHWSNLISGISTSDIIALTKQHNVTRFVLKWALSLETSAYASLLHVISEVDLKNYQEYIGERILKTITENGPFEPELNETMAKLVEWVISSQPNISSEEIDNVEVVLQTSITRPSVTTEAINGNNGDSKPVNGHKEANGTATNREKIVEMSEDMQQATTSSFLAEPLKFDARTDLWVKASSNSDIRPEELITLARVSPDAVESFLLAVAIAPLPTVSRLSAIVALEKKIVDSASDNSDLQALIPSILYLLSDREQRIRQQATKVLEAVKSHKPSKSQKPMYFDSIYGENSKKLTWLSRSDVSSVIKKLLETLEECVLDQDYVFTSCRQAGKAAWSEFLCSHAIETSLPQVRWFILTALCKFKGVVKHIAPLLETWFQPEVQKRWSEHTKVAKFSMEKLEAALIKVIRSNTPTGIKFLQNTLKRGGDAALEACSHIIAQWSIGTWNEETQDMLAETLLDLSVNETSTFDPVDCLLKLKPFSTDLFATLLERCRLNEANHSGSTKQQAADSQKRRRRRSSSSMQLRGASMEMMSYAERHLRRVTLILELIDPNASSLNINAQNASKLFGALFDILEELLSLGADSNLPVLYTEEVLANCMISLVDNVIANRNIVADINMSSIRVSLIVSCIRTSTSPQLQNRLLLLVASLARLSPDLVLHSVMPIFTFMGANTVRLDNDYSAHVIQETITQVIPALVDCGDKHEEIEMALMSFVAAFPHIPRHRRNKLYGALIKTLGPQESLYKLLLLLGQRYGEAVIQKRSSDSKAIVHFTTTFLRSFSIQEQLEALGSYIRFIPPGISGDGDSEATSPIEGKMDVDSIDRTESNGESFGLINIKSAIKKLPKLRDILLEFLVLTGGNDQVISGTQPLRLQIASSPEGSFTAEHLKLCTDMLSNLVSQWDEGNSTVISLLSKILELLPIEQFVETVIPILDNSDARSRNRILDLIASKFDFEQASSPSAIAAVDVMIDCLEKQISTPNVTETLDQFIVKFGSEIRPEIQLQLLDILCGPSGLLSEHENMLIPAVCCINSLCQQLGARMIGHFPRIMPVLFTKCEKLSERDDPEQSSSLELATFALFGGLVQRIPSFMEPIMKQAVGLVLASHADLEPRRRLLELINEKMDTPAVIAVYATSWDSAVRGGMSSIELFFSSFENMIDNSSKRDIAAKTVALGGLITKWFGTRASSRFGPNETNQVEGRAVATALNIVLKLNDKSFRPLFVHITRWAFEDQNEHLGSYLRHIPAMKFICKLLASLKSIVTNYFGYILDHVCEIISVKSYERDNESFAVLHKLVLQSLYLSFSSDQDDFWQAPSRFDKILHVLLEQYTLPDIPHGSLLVKAVSALAEASSSQQHRKKINDELAKLLTGDASSSQKIWVVRTLSSLYNRLGEDWISNLPQLVPLIAELLDDEDEAVEDETRRSLVPVIEDVLGESLDRYLA